jgi:N-acetylmuramoyl-L-alanine amidase
MPPLSVSPPRHRRRAGAAALALLLCLPGVGSADTIRAAVRQTDSVRVVQLRREGGEIFVPLVACGPLLGTEARWDPATNRWWFRSKSLVAAGFLDEPLLFVAGQPLLVRTPPRLIGRAPYLSLEALRLLGRRGWDTDVAWDEAAKELAVRPAQAQAEAGAGAVRTRTLKPPAVPPGARVLALDPGHPRGSGAEGMRGLNEGDLGLAVAQAIAATALVEGLAPVLLREGDDALEPYEVASLANTLHAEAFVSFHGSTFGDPGVTVWVWGAANMGGAGIAFAPFEPETGWVGASQGASSKSAALARRIVRALEEAGVPVRGPLPAPLLALEGLSCPAVAIEFEGLGTPEGARLAADEAVRARLAVAVSNALAADLKPASPPEDKGTQEGPATQEGRSSPEGQPSPEGRPSAKDQQ